MTENKVITISHFSDVLCIWAYIAQIRVDELKREHAAAVDLQYHFFPVFGAVDALLEKNWSAQGGVGAYNKHVLSLLDKFDHIQVNPNLWLINQPKSSLPCHLHFKAVQLLEAEGHLPPDPDAGHNSCFESYAWRVRQAFFKDAENVSDYDVLMYLAEQHGLPVNLVEEKINSGEAHAAMDLDLQLARKYNIVGSPTLIFNEGRQSIYGNVGYRVIEANIRELLQQPENQSSWC